MYDDLPLSEAAPAAPLAAPPAAPSPRTLPPPPPQHSTAEGKWTV